MNDKINPVEMYAKVISEQARKERGDVSEAVKKFVGPGGKVTTVNVPDKPAMQKKAEKHAGGAELNHLASHENHHVYDHEDADIRGDHQMYHVHDSKTGKTHTVSLSSKKHSVDSVHKAMNKEVPGGVHKDLASKVAKAHNENF